MENAKNLAAALAKTQRELKPAVKDSTNPAFRGTKYADLTAVWDACRDALSNNGISVLQVPNFDSVDMWLETVLLHTSGESISGRYPIRPTKADPQGYGSALTYARRYSLASMVGVVADDDDDGNAASGKQGCASAQTPAPREPVEVRNDNAGGDEAAKAKSWGEDAIRYVNRTGDSAKFKEWHDRNLQTIARLGELHPDIHTRLLVAISGREDAFAAARAA